MLLLPARGKLLAVGASRTSRGALSFSGRPTLRPITRLPGLGGCVLHHLVLLVPLTPNNILSATPATCWCLRRASTSRAGWLPEQERQNNTGVQATVQQLCYTSNRFEPLLLDLTTLLLLQRSLQNHRVLRAIFPLNFSAHQWSCPRWIPCCGWRARWWYLRSRCPSHSSGCGHSPSHSVRCHCPWIGGRIRDGAQDVRWICSDLWFVERFEDMDNHLSEVMWPLLLSERSEGGAVDSPSGGETVLHCTTMICTNKTVICNELFIQICVFAFTWRHILLIPFRSRYN